MKKKYNGVIILDEINKDNVFENANGKKCIHVKMTLYDDKEAKGETRGLIAQRFLIKNAKDSNGNWIQTPIIGNIYKKK